MKQSLQALRKAHYCPFIWHPDFIKQIAASLRSSQNPFSSNTIGLDNSFLFLAMQYPNNKLGGLKVR